MLNYGQNSSITQIKLRLTEFRLEALRGTEGRYIEDKGGNYQLEGGTCMSEGGTYHLRGGVSKIRVVSTY